MTDRQYLEMLQKQKERERKELGLDKSSWSFPPDNGATGEAVKDYYKRHGYV